MKSISCILFLAALIFVHSAEHEDQKKLKEAIKFCKNLSGVSQDQINKLRNGEREDHFEIKKYTLCTMQKAEFIDEKGNLQVENIRQKMIIDYGNKKDADNLVEKCVFQRGSLEDSAYETLLCGYQLRKKAE